MQHNAANMKEIAMENQLHSFPPAQIFTSPHPNVQTPAAAGVKC